MTQDDVIRMAREARLIKDWMELCKQDSDALARFAALVAEQERQDCARVVMSFKNWSRVDLLPISEAIKSRGLSINRGKA